MIFNLVQDFADVLSAMPFSHPRLRMLMLIDESLRRDLQFIEVHPTTLFQCLWNTCWWHDSPQTPLHRRRIMEQRGAPPTASPIAYLHVLLEEWRGRKDAHTPGFPWIRSLRPPILELGSGLRWSFLNLHQPNKVVCSHDGARIAAMNPNRVCLWDLHTGHMIQDFAIETRVHDIAFSSAGALMAAYGDWDDPKKFTVVIWDVQARREVSRVQVEESKWNWARLSPQASHVALGNAAQLEVFTVPTGRPVFAKSNEAHFTDGFFSQSGDWFAARSDSHEVHWWRIDKECSGHDSALGLEQGFALGFLNDGRLAISTEEGVTLIHPARKERRCVRCVDDESEAWPSRTVTAISPNGQYVARRQSHVGVWETATGRLVCRYPGDPVFIGDFIFTHDGRRLVEPTSEGLVIRDLPAGDATVRVVGSEASGIRELVGHLTLTPNDQFLIGVAGQGMLRVWSVAEMNLQPPQRVDPDYEVEQMFISGDRWVSTLARRNYSGEPKAPQRWDLRTGRLYPFPEHDALRVSCTASAHFGPMLGFGCHDGRILLWRPDRQPALSECGRHDGAATCVVFFPGDERLLSSGADDTLRIWDLNGKELQRIPDNAQGAAQLVIGPHGRLALGYDEDCLPPPRWIESESDVDTAQNDKWLTVWDLTAGCRLARLSASLLEPLESFWFSPYGRSFAVVGRDQRVLLWDEACGDALVELPEHDGQIRSIAFSADGKWLAGGGDDYVSRVWDVTKRLLHCRLAQPFAAEVVAKQPLHVHFEENRLIAVGRVAQNQFDNNIWLSEIVWELPSGICLEARSPRLLTPDFPTTTRDILADLPMPAGIDRHLGHDDYGPWSLRFAGLVAFFFETATAAEAGWFMLPEEGLDVFHYAIAPDRRSFAFATGQRMHLVYLEGEAAKNP